MLDLEENPNCWFSQSQAQILDKTGETVISWVEDIVTR